MSLLAGKRNSQLVNVRKVRRLGLPSADKLMSLLVNVPC